MALIKCKECGGEVSTAAASCPKCGAVVKKSPKKLSGCLIFFVVVFAFIIYANNSGKKSTVEIPSSTVSPPTKEVAADGTNSQVKDSTIPPSKLVSEQNWYKGSVKDEMTDKEKPFVTSTSINGVDFKFPYHVDGGSKATIVIRKDSKRKVGYVMVEKGHIICSYQNCTIQTRSETGKIDNWSASEASPGVNNAIFIDDVNAFEKYLRSNKKIRVGLEFYEYGIKSFDFNVSGYPGT